MQTLILYQSRNGHTRSAAQAIERAVYDQHSTAKVKAVIEVQPNDIAQADVLFIGTWVHGMIVFGVKPAEAALWVPALPPLNGKPVGVFCTYAFNPRSSLKTLSDMLAGRGAVIAAQKAFHRSRPDEGVNEFVETVFRAATASQSHG